MLAQCARVNYPEKPGPGRSYAASGDLDECGGHTDGPRGYHYHVGAPGSNRILGAFRGRPGTARVDR